MLKIFKIFLVTVGIVILATGCYRKGENIPVNPPTASTYLTDGWTAFESADYEAAEAAFTASKDRDALNPEAFLGLGWTNSRQLKYDQALANFKIMQSITDDPNMLADSHAGLAMLFAAMKRDEEAAKNAEEALRLNNSYQFNHDNYINAEALAKVLARSYINTGDYLSALNVVETYISQGFSDQLVSEGVLIKAEGMVAAPILSPTSLVDGTAILRLTKELDGKPVAIELVKVLDVKNMAGTVSYQIVSVQIGGSDITVKGNPVPTSGDMFKVDLLYASNFGRYLAKLYEKVESLKTNG